METTVKQRLITFIEYLGISKNHFENVCGLSTRYVSNINTSITPVKLKQISLKYPQLNTGWLLTGEGSMLKTSSPSIMQNNVNGDNNYNQGECMPVKNSYSCNHDCANCQRKIQCKHCGSTDIEIVEAEEVRRPIIPTEWTYETDVDILSKVQQNLNRVSRSRFVALDVPIDLWHIVRDDSLLPDCKRGDMLALNAYPIGYENPIPGKLHAVDTRSNGIIVRRLYYEDYGFRGVAPNRDFPDMPIYKDDIIRVFRIVCLARIAL